MLMTTMGMALCAADFQKTMELPMSPRETDNTRPTRTAG